MRVPNYSSNIFEPIQTHHGEKEQGSKEREDAEKVAYKDLCLFTHDYYKMREE